VGAATKKFFPCGICGRFLSVFFPQGGHRPLTWTMSQSSPLCGLDAQRTRYRSTVFLHPRLNSLRTNGAITPFYYDCLRLFRAFYALLRGRRTFCNAIRGEGFERKSFFGRSIMRIWFCRKVFRKSFSPSTRVDGTQSSPLKRTGHRPLKRTASGNIILLRKRYFEGNRIFAMHNAIREEEYERKSFFGRSIMRIWFCRKVFRKSFHRPRAWMLQSPVRLSGLGAVLSRGRPQVISFCCEKDF